MDQQLIEVVFKDHSGVNKRIVRAIDISNFFFKGGIEIISQKVIG